MLAWVLAAHAGPIDLGVGLRREQYAFDANPWGVELAGRAQVTDYFAIEVSLYGRYPSPAVSDLTKTLVAIAYEGDPETNFRQPVTREVASLTALAVLSPWRRPAAGKLSAWAYGVGGLGGLLLVDDVAIVNPAYASYQSDEPAVVQADPDIRVVIAPTIGAGFEVWFREGFGLRTMGTERIWVALEPDYGNIDQATGEPEPLDNRLYGSAAVSLDLMFRL